MFNKCLFLGKLFFNHIYLEDDIQYVGLCRVKFFTYCNILHIACLLMFHILKTIEKKFVNIMQYLAR